MYVMMPSTVHRVGVGGALVPVCAGVGSFAHPPFLLTHLRVSVICAFLHRRRGGFQRVRDGVRVGRCVLGYDMWV